MASWLEGLRFHDLRHTAGTLAAQTGATTKELMARLGHASSRAAMVYQHASDQRDRVIAERLATMAEEAGVLTVVPLEFGRSKSICSGTDVARNRIAGRQKPAGNRLTSPFSVVGDGIDPSTSRFSGARSTN